ncbi:rhox homeobox family member 1-like [Microtus ochrogaster]|uniref:Rhox homeobox family member 1-like n=1 Tax=Microtus ochrogaster TaxID=79684 RepID=A0ABM0LSR0_MICOH|nr:rhox homeobox family member 1-like [Microtus ochrogaster]
MAFQSQHVDPNVYKLDVNEIEVSLDFEQEATAATESVIFGEGSQNGSGKPKNQGIPHRKDDVTHVANFNYIGDDIRHESHGSHQGYRNPQLKEQENVAAARVPQVRRTRPRIQFGLTLKQLNELEDVFEKTKYPNEIIRKDLAKRLFLGESRVRSWFKKRRTQYRKHQQSQILQCASDDGQDTLQ